MAAGTPAESVSPTQLRRYPGSSTGSPATSPSKGSPCKISPTKLSQPAVPSMQAQSPLVPQQGSSVISMIRAASLFVPSVGPLTSMTVVAGSMVDWASNRTAKILASPFKGYSRPVATAGTTAKVHVQLLSGADFICDVLEDLTLHQLKELIFSQTGVNPDLQAVIVSELRVRHSKASVQDMVRYLASQWTTRKETTRVLMDWINYTFLPEVLNRELNGRGLLSWAKCGLYERIKAARPDCRERLTMQVETLSGKLDLVELTGDTAVWTIKVIVRREYNIPSERQRLIIAEKQPPSPLTHLTNTMLLHAYNGVQSMANMVVRTKQNVWDRYRFGKPFVVSVTASSGRRILVEVMGNTTMAELQAIMEVQEQGEGQQATPVSAVSFEPHTLGSPPTAAGPGESSPEVISVRNPAVFQLLAIKAQEDFVLRNDMRV